MKPCPAALALVSLLACGITAAQGPEPLSAVNPVDGSTRTVALDAPLTHVVFFATWCPPCLREFAALRDLEARWQPDGYRLVLVAVARRETESRLARFVGDESPPGLVLFDRSGKLESRFGIDGLPGHVLLGPGGGELARGPSLEAVSAAVGAHLGRR